MSKHEIFKPTHAQQRMFASIRDYVVGHRDEFVPAVSLIDAEFPIATVLQRLGAGDGAWRPRPWNEPFLRLYDFARVASNWDLSHYKDEERMMRIHAILYIAWLMTDADASRRGVGLSEMERTPMRAPNQREDTELDRGFAKWSAFEPGSLLAAAWMAQVQFAWDEVLLSPAMQAKGGEDALSPANEKAADREHDTDADAKRTSVVGEPSTEVVAATAEQDSASKREDQKPVLEPVEKAQPSEEPASVFRRSGDIWTFRFGEYEAQCKHYLGLTYIQILLDRAGQVVGVQDLEAAAGRAVIVSASMQPTMDKDMRDAATKRLEDVTAQLADSDAGLSSEQREHLEDEASKLQDVLRSATGIAGRSRLLGDEVEAARSRTAQAISAALRALERVHPRLTVHLKAFIHEPAGRYPAYRPNPDVVWVTNQTRELNSEPSVSPRLTGS